jgi:hypothetical protein
MKILVACEHSGTVRDELLALGHDATSCDILPTDTPGPHYQGDVRDILGQPWDMVIAFPPCTHLAVSGAKHFAQKRADGRQQEGIDFFMLFTRLECPRVATGAGRHGPDDGSDRQGAVRPPTSSFRW